jgi:hypothetical protein
LTGSNVPLSGYSYDKATGKYINESTGEKAVLSEADFMQEIKKIF